MFRDQRKTGRILSVETTLSNTSWNTVIAFTGCSRVYPTCKCLGRNLKLVHDLRRMHSSMPER